MVKRLIMMMMKKKNKIYEEIIKYNNDYYAPIRESARKNKPLYTRFKTAANLAGVSVSRINKQKFYEENADPDLLENLKPIKQNYFKNMAHKYKINYNKIGGKKRKSKKSSPKRKRRTNRRRR